VDLQTQPLKLASPHIFGLEMIYQSIVTTLSLQIALRESDQNIPEAPHKSRAIESSKRLLQLLQIYMETYSFSATAPTFGLILKYCLPRSLTRDLVSDVELGIRNKIQSFSTHLGQLWLMPERLNTGRTMGQRTQETTVSPATSQQPDLATHDVQHIMPAHTPQHLGGSAEPHPPQTTSHPPTSDPFLSAPWLRAPQNIDDGAGLLPTPPSMSAGGGSEVPGQPGQLDASLGNGMRPSPSAPSKSQSGPPMIPDLTTSPFPPGGQYPAPYQDPSLGLSPFVDMEGYGAQRRQQPQQQRIAPDLDALFDELASLDGAEKYVFSSTFRHGR
jgi:hypothetical protein